MCSNPGYTYRVDRQNSYSRHNFHIWQVMSEQKFHFQLTEEVLIKYVIRDLH
jgi:hypothetical protein